MAVQFNQMQEYARNAVEGFLTHKGLSDIVNLTVSLVIDDHPSTDTFTITVDSYTFDGNFNQGPINATIVFQDNLLESSTGLPAVFTNESIQRWYEFSNPEKNDDYARLAVEKLFTQAQIPDWHNLNAQVGPVEGGGQSIIITADYIRDIDNNQYDAIRIEFLFDQSGDLSSANGIPPAISNTLNHTYIENWYEYSGPDKQRQEDQQDGDYFDEGHQDEYSNVWTWTDEQGVLWTVVDKDINGVHTSTETSSNGDVREHSSSWDPSTQTQVWTNNFTNSDATIDFTMVENQASDGSVTQVLTGKTDHIDWLYLGEIYTDVNVTIARDDFWNITDVTGTAKKSDATVVNITWSNGDFLFNGEFLGQHDDFVDDQFQQRNEWEWTDWDGTIWEVVEEDISGVWTMTETSYTDDGSGRVATGHSRSSYSDWDDANQISTWTQSETRPGGINFTRVEVNDQKNGEITVTITGTTDDIVGNHLGDIFTVDVTVTRDSNWQLINATGTVSKDGETLDITYSNNNILINGKSTHEFKDEAPSFEQGQINTWTWTDHEGVTWTVENEEKATDIVTINTQGSEDIILTFDVDSNELLSASGIPQDSTGLDENSLIAWYPTEVSNPMDQGSWTDEQEISFAKDKILAYVSNNTNLSGVTADDIHWDISDTMSSTETSSNGDVRVHLFTWTNNSSNMVEKFTSADQRIDYTRSEIWNENGTSTETITGATDQLAWMMLDGVYTDLNVTITHDWDTVSISGSGKKEGVDVEFSTNPNGELLIDGNPIVFDAGHHGGDAGQAMQENWDNTWEWTEHIGGEEIIWQVTDSQQGEKWTSTEIAYTEDEHGVRTPTGAERTHSSLYNERTQTNIWTDSEKSADGSRDFTRVETKRADGSSTEKITGKVDKFGSYDNVDVTIERDANWGIISVVGTADGSDVGYDGSDITIGGVKVGSYDTTGAHGNEEMKESSWTWTDWEGVIWTVTDKQEGDTWTSTEISSDGDIRVHKNTWSGNNETWSDSFTSADGSIDMTRFETKRADGSSTEKITGKDDGFGWWDFAQSYENLDVTITRNVNWEITDVSGSADGGVVFSFNSQEQQLYINDVVYNNTAADDRAHMIQENSVNTWEWTDGEGVVWEVTDKQEGDTWSSTEVGSNGDMRVHTDVWDDELNNYAKITTFKSGSSDEEFSTREVWNDDGTSTETVTGATDHISWYSLGDMFTDLDVTITRDNSWNTVSIVGTGDNATMGYDDIAIGYNAGSDILTIDGQDVYDSGGGTAQEQSWSSSWEWTDWIDGQQIVWEVTDNQQGDTWTSTEIAYTEASDGIRTATGDQRTSVSTWDPVKQTSVWKEAVIKQNQGLDFERVEKYNPNGTSSETITGSTDHIAWWPLHEVYTDVDVTIERDANWNVYKITGSGTDADNNTADFGWSEEQVTFDGNFIEDSQQHFVNTDQYWENESTWTDGGGVTWQVLEVQDGDTWTRTETGYSDDSLTTATGEVRTEKNVWNHETGTSTWSRSEVDHNRGINCTRSETGIWDETTQTNIWSETITGRNDHIDWMPLGDVHDLDLTITYDDYHNITDITGNVISGTWSSGAWTPDETKVVTYDNGQILIDGQAVTMTWTDWDGSIWEVQEQQDGGTHTRTETQYESDGITTTGAVRVETHIWDDDTQTNTMTETLTKDGGATLVVDVVKVESHAPGSGSTMTITGKTDHIEWMNLGDHYSDMNITIERDENWNIKSIEGSGTDSQANTKYFGFSGSDNQLMIGDDANSLTLVAGEAGHKFENTWNWTDGEGITWTVTDEQRGDTWTSREEGSNGDVRIHESTWDQTNQTNTWSESFISNDGSLDFTKTEVYDESTNTSTMTTTGKTDHVGWMYLGETYTEVDVTETRNENWEVVTLSGSARNSDGETVSFGWELGQITIDGDTLTTSGTEDFAKSADNYKNEWTYYDHEGTEWTVTEFQQEEAWISEERSEYGDKRFFKTLWGFEDQNSNGTYDVWNDSNGNHKYDAGEGDKGFTKDVEKYASADGDIKYKTVTKYYDNGSIMMKMKGASDHLFNENLGEIYTDIDVKIVYRGNGTIKYVENYDGNGGSPTAKNADGDTVNISFNNDRILIDNMDIHNLGDDFYKDFSQDDMAHFDNMESGTWEFDFQDREGNQVHVVEEGKATDIVSIKTDSYEYDSTTHDEGLDIVAVFDADSGDLLSVTGLPVLVDIGFGENDLQGWYQNSVIPDFPYDPSEQQEINFINNKVNGFLQNKNVTPDNVSLDIGFDISDTRLTTETVYIGENWENRTDTENITVRSRTEQLGKEVEREESYQNQSDYDNGVISSWEQTERIFTQGEFGFEMVEENTTSDGEDLTVTVISNPDGTQTMQATGTAYFEMNGGMLITDVNVTSQMNGPRFIDFVGTGTIAAGTPGEQDVVVKSDGTSPHGDPLIRLIFEDGTETKAYDPNDLKAAEMHSSGNPLEHNTLKDGDGYRTSPDWSWEQTGFTTNSETETFFEGVRHQDGKPDQTIRVEETRTYNAESQMLETINQNVTTSRGEDYTAEFTLNERFDVEVDINGTKQYRGELYSNVDIDKEITPTGQVMIEGTAKKFDGTDVEFFKGHHDNSLEIISVDKDGKIHKLAEDSGGDSGSVNEMHQWQFTDHEGEQWTVIEKFDGQSRTSHETTAEGDERIIEEIWDNNGGFTHTMTEAFIDEPVITETRISTPGFSGGKYQEVQTVVRTNGGVEVENFTETIVFEADFTSTKTVTGMIDFMGVSYENASITVVQDENWNATEVNGTAVRVDDQKATTITMDGTHPWGEPKLVFTVAGEDAVSDTRTVIDNKVIGNNDPSVVDDAKSINENETVIIDVLANDSDADVDDDLAIKSIGEASYGKVFLAEGKIFYTPNLDYSGSDSFDYTVTDGRGGIGQGEVTITVSGLNNAPTAVDDSYTIMQGSAPTILDLLANDSDIDGDELSISGINPLPTTAGGWVDIVGDLAKYELPDPVDGVAFTGVDTFTYYAYDSTDRTGAEVTITVEALNNAPVAAADAITINEDDEAVQVRVLANDTDADNDVLSVDSFTNPEHGSVRMLGGFLFYTPDSNYYGNDSFTYTVVDEDTASATETVTITVDAVNDAPVTVTDILNVEEGSDGITLDVISNDYDREGDSFSLTSVGNALHGTVVIDDNDMVVYTPEVDYTGADEFTYTTTDVNGAESTGTVSVTVSMANNDPVAVTDAVTVGEDSTNNRISVLTNDTDPEGNTIELSSVSSASHGTTEIALNNILYTPDANYSGSDSFNYRINDGKGGTDKGTVNITVNNVNDIPVAVDDALGSVSSMKTVRLDVDMLNNDSDADSNDVISIKSVGEATYGNVVLSGGRVNYKADRGSSGETDSFTYTIEDEDGEEATATVTFTISTNTNPNAVDDTVIIAEDAIIGEIDIDENTDGVQAVKSNDIDVDGDSLTVVGIDEDPSHGVASLQNGKIFYVPDTNYTGDDSFTYKISDGEGGIDVATVNITITADNDAPTAINDREDVEVNTTANVFDVLDNDSDIDGDSISIDSVTDPLHGTATVSGDGLDVVYTPDTDYTGVDSFTYKVTDGSVTSTATVNVTVNAANNVPTINADSTTVVEDSNVNQIDVLANDTDPDSDTLSIASVTQGENGKVSLTNGNIYYTPDENFFGEDIFTYTANDGNGGISSARVTVTVTGEDDSPTVVNDELEAVKAGSGAAAVDLISNDIDPDGDSIEITAVGDARYGTTSFINGVVYYKPANTSGSDLFSYTLSDAGGNESTGYASIEVGAPNNSPTGTVTITGGAQPYQVLTANNTIADSDGISNDFSYQWYRDGSEIIGETDSTYTVTLEDIGSTFSVGLSYTDDLGTAESQTSDETDTVSLIDQPFTFYQSGEIVDGILTLVLKADVEAIYSRDDITGLTGADLNLDIDWSQFHALEEDSTVKFDITNSASNLIALESSSTSDTATFDTLTLASTRMTGPLLTLVDTDATNNVSTGIGTTVDLLEIDLKPADPDAKLAIELSGTVVANKGQIEFTQYDSTMSNLTGIATNSDPVGDVTITGTFAVDETLTAAHTLTDADGMNPVSYQWLRDGADIIGATGSTYTVAIADINKDISVEAEYTDGGDTVESETSSATTVTQSTVNKPFMFTSELITASEASIDMYGADYSVNGDETILKLTLNGDITRFDASHDNIASVAGAELDVSIDWTEFENFSYTVDGTTVFTETYEMDKVYTGSLFLGEIVNDDGEFSKIIFSSLNTSKKPVLTLIDNVETTGRGYTDRPTDVDLATIYLNPIDSVKDVEITFGGDISVNQGDDTFNQLSHSLEVEVSTYDAIISTESTKGLNDITINLWDDGVDTGSSVAVDTGEISIDATVDFDEIKLSEDAYDFDSAITISDAIGVLRHIVDLDTLTGDQFHAADVNNSNTITISDAIGVLRHIVDLDTIDSYDLVDDEGNRIVQLDSNMQGDPPQWTIVANGDVNQSGDFVEDYVATLDII